MLANAVSVMSNILATFLREACPHVGAHFWVRLPVAYLYFCVRTFCVNISTGHAARPAHGDPIWLRLHIFALVCRGVIRHTDKWGSHSKGILRIFVPIHKLRNLVGLVCE